jgi:hypothetical protein
MAIIVNDNLQNNSPKSLDNKYTKFDGILSNPYTNTAEVNSTILPSYRSIGLTVLVQEDGKNVEYWYRAGTANGDLVKKTGAENINQLIDVTISNPSTGQILYYNGTEWVNGGVNWGQIGGTLSNQSDLQNALNLKFNTPTGTINEYIRGNGSIATFPTIPAQVNLIAGTNIVITGTYPNLTISSTGTAPVTSVFGRTGAITAQSGDYSAFYAPLSRTITGAKSLTGGGDLSVNRTLELVGDLVSPGNSMLYGTNELGVRGWYAQPNGTVTSVGLTMPSAFTVSNSPITNSGNIQVVGSGTASQYITGQGQLATLNTDAVTEGNNLYFTTTRVRESISVSGQPLTYNTLTGVLGIIQADSTNSGYLTSTDWNTFNSKVSPTRAISTLYSIVGGGDLSSDRTFSLVNDVASPGANKFYGTDALGDRGWFNVPVDSGEVNTASNLGVTGARVFSSKVGTDLQFRRLVAGANMTITENANDIVFAAAATGGATLSDGNYGDVTVSGTGTSITINDGAVLFSKIQNISTNTVLGRHSAGTGTVQQASLGTGLIYQTGALTVTLSPFTTTNLAEGVHQYFTQSRARASISATSPLVYSSTTGIISITQSNSTTSGFLSSSDWNTFNNKVSSTRNVLTINSLTGGGDLSSDRTLQLVNDSLAPGNNKLYGTDGAGVRGWFDRYQSVSIVSANGLSGTVATPTTTPAITLSTSVNGMVKGNGTAFSAAVVGVDYSQGTATLATGILKSTTGTGELSIAIASDFPILNQNTTGTASNITGVLNTSSFPGLTGDVSVPVGSTVSTINANVVTFSKFQQLPTTSLVGRYSSGIGNAQSITIGTNLTLDSITGVLSAIGGGTVSSISAGNLAPVFTTTVDNSTTTPALSFTLTNQTQNTIFSGPVSGTGAPTFRTLVSNDIPNLPASKITTGIFPIERGGTGLSALGTANQMLRVNATATALEYFTPSYLTANQSITFTASGDISGTSSGTTTLTPALTIITNAVTNAKLADVPTATFKGRITAGVGDPQDLTSAQATSLLDVFTSTLKGVVPASGGGTVNFLRADGTWSPVTGSGNVTSVASGDLVPLFTTSVTDPTGAASISFNLSTVNANLVFAGPTTGIAAQPSFRALVSNDIPNLDTAKITSGVFPITRGGTGLSSIGTANQLIRVNASGTGLEYFTPSYLVANQSISFNATGDVTGSSSGQTSLAPTLTISANSVNNTKLADMPTLTIKGRVSAGTGDPEDLNSAQATSILDVFTSTLKGLTPASGGGTTNFLRADGTWANPSGTGGTVTSVSIGNLSPLFTASVATATTTPSISFALSNAAQNTVFAGPTSGTGAPSFRSLVSADIPNLDASKITTGILSIARGGTGLGSLGTANQLIRVNGTGTALEYFTPTYLTSNQTITFTASGDVTGTITGTTSLLPSLTIANGVVTNAKLANMPTLTIKGRNLAGTGVPQDLTGPQVTELLSTFSASFKGLVPPSGGGITKFLRSDGTWSTINAVDPSISVTGTLSVQGGGDLTQSRTLSLVGDVGTPGILKYYGTNESGIKTWIDFYTVSRNSISVVSPLEYNPATGIVSILQASSINPGFVSSADWITFNNKVSTTRAVNTTGSLTGGGNLSADRTLQLVNDITSPGNNQYYGTNSSGVKGYFPIPGASTLIEERVDSIVLTNGGLNLGESLFWAIPVDHMATIEVVILFTNDSDLKIGEIRREQMFTYRSTTMNVQLVGATTSFMADKFSDGVSANLYATAPEFRQGVGYPNYIELLLYGVAGKFVKATVFSKVRMRPIVSVVG